MEGHGEYPGYYLVEIFGTFFPWCLLLPTAVGLAWRHRHEPATRFAIAAAMGPWLMMEMVRTKLPFYILPAFPPLAFITADAVARSIRGECMEFTRPLFGAGVAVWGAAAILLGLSPWSLAIHADDFRAGSVRSLVIHLIPWSVAPRFEGLPFSAMTVFAAFAIVYAFAVAFLFHFRKIAAAAAAMGAGVLVMVALLYGWLLPALTPLNLSAEAAADLSRAGGIGAGTLVAMIDYKEPSLAFDQGGGAREKDDGYLVTTPPENWARWIVTTQSEWNLTPPRLRQCYQEIGRHYGLMYAGGLRPATVLVLEEKPAEEAAAAVRP
jgi:hypothetical protein